MKAMILAAGLGTRLRPLTERMPKPLMPVANRPVLLRNMEYLRAHGVDDVVVNAHYHAAQVVDFLRSHPLPCMRAEVRVEEQILGTGGGIANTADFWSHEPFFVLNGDILTDIDLTKALLHHRSTGHLATLILHDRPPYNKIRLDPKGCVTEIPHHYGGNGWAFTGIHILQPEILTHLPMGVFSDIVDCYRGLIHSGRGIGAYLSKSHRWRDIGTVSEYLQANQELSPAPFLVDAGCEIDPSVRWKDWAVIGPGCRVDKDAEITRSVLWPNVSVKAGVTVRDSVLTSGLMVESDLSGAAL
jgi:mannose-1-phosphate guanylyltransferase